MKVAPNLTEEHSGMLKNIQKPNRLTDRAISVITISNMEKQEILEELDIKIRMEKALNLISPFETLRFYKQALQLKTHYEHCFLVILRKT